MAIEEANYFSSQPVEPTQYRPKPETPATPPEPVGASAAQPGEQLSCTSDFGLEEAPTSQQTNVLPTSFTRENLPRGAWCEIDLEAIKHNTRLAIQAIGAHRKLCAVVKADAYGHGAPEVAKAALFAGASSLAVACVDEAVRLRQAGISAPILVLSQPPASAIPYILEHNIATTVCTAEFAIQLGEAAAAAGTQAPFHLAVDTGMSRIGVPWSEATEFLQGISFHCGLLHEGTFTHFATADCADDIDFKLQVERFERALASMRQAGVDPGCVHAANSASIFRYPHVHYDMCRLGVALYGLNPNPGISAFDTLNLKPAMAVKALVSFAKEPEPGEGVSYGLTHRVRRGQQICTVPVGYADGMRRELSNSWEVLCGGRSCRQVGRICMDQMMFEVPLMRTASGRAHRPAEVGDEVVIIGRQGNLQITADAMAAKLGTINHEIVCLFALRLPRIYV